MEPSPAQGVPRRNIKLVIAYNGAAYHGWQRQLPGFDTVQERVEQAAVRVVKHPVTVFGASRTDARVHAEGQVANFYTTAGSIPLQGLQRAINARLPRDIAIISATEVADDFHASRSATGKTYRYRICTADVRPVMLAGLVYHFPWRPLDIEAMRDAAGRLVGEHDFRGLTTSMEVRENTVRRIDACQVARRDPEIVISVTGNGFLYNMVRNIVGTLMEIGRGRWEPRQIDTILASRDRGDAGPTASPDGLTLKCVYYDAAARANPAPASGRCV